MLISELADKVDRHIGPKMLDGEPVSTDLPGLVLLRHRKPTTFECTVYRPIMCLILQGSKETGIGSNMVRFGPGESLIVSHDLPVVSRVTQASASTPYLALVLAIDVGIVRSLYDKIGDADIGEDRLTALNIGDADDALVEALARYFSLLDRPVEAEVLGPLVVREIHFRLLMAPHGGMLRNLLRRDSHASRISRAIERIRRDYRVAMKTNELANEVGMSVSSFHEHFRAVTATTPLQYQKDLRLMEARRLIIEGDHTVSAAAYQVGYESPTQFSREYSRKFGAPPRADMATVA